MLTALDGSRVALHTRPLVYHADGTASAEKQAVLARIPAGARVLEVGAHTGTFSALLRERGCRVTALEADPRAAVLARGRADRVVVGDVEDARLRAGLGTGFDHILFMHVLEHLVDPWSVVRAARPMLAPGGRVLALLPNVACWRVRKTLFFGGTFAYEDTGILDRTHLRFFTLDSGRGLFVAAGFAVETIGIDVCVPLERRMRQRPCTRRLASAWRRAVAGRWPNLCTEIALFEAHVP